MGWCPQVFSKRVFLWVSCVEGGDVDGRRGA